MTEGLRIGVVGVPGGWSTEALADAAEARTGGRIIIDASTLVYDSAASTVRSDDLDLRGLDAIVIKKIGSGYGPQMLERLELLRFVSDMGVPIYSPPARILEMVNRVACTVRLRAAGIPMPETVITEDPKRALEAVERFGEAVLKSVYSTKGEGVVLVEAGPDAEATLAEHFASSSTHYIQRRIDLGGRDLGVAFLAGQHLGTYARVAGEGSWQTTIRSGGRYEAFDLAPEIVEMARRAQAAFGLTFTGVDVALAEEGPMVFEVSAFGGYRGLRDGLGIDASGRVIEHVIGELGGSPAGAKF